MEIKNIENKKYYKKSHLTYSCQYHVIFCPKYRRSILKEEYQLRLKEIFKDVSVKYDFNIIEMEIMEDHVHLLLECNPRFGVMKCVHKLKGTSSNLMFKEFPKLKSKLPTLWTRSAFISTVGSVSLEVVKKYIEEQKNV